MSLYSPMAAPYCVDYRRRRLTRGRDDAVTPVLSGPEARHQYDGEHEQDGGDANGKCDGECHELLPGSLSRGQAR